MKYTGLHHFLQKKSMPDIWQRRDIIILKSTAKILNFKQGWMDHDIPRSNELNLNQSLKLNDPISQRKAQIVHSTYPIAQLWLTTTLGSLSDTITV